MFQGDLMSRALVAVVAALVGTASLGSTARATATSQPPLQVELDALVDEFAVGGLAEVKEGRTRSRVASGRTQLRGTQAVRADSQVRIGSITKTFLATVTLQMVDEGWLRLDDPVEKWLPGSIPNGEKVTVRHLLNHTSGLYDYRLTLDLPPDPGFLQYRKRTWMPAELIRRAVSHPPTSQQPGKDFAYTNTGYVLLGEIVRRATGVSYDEQIRQRILQPLKLTGTLLPGTSTRIPGPHPHGYVPIGPRTPPELVDFTEMNPSLFGAGGEIISTTRDLNRFFAALLGGDLLPKRLLQQMKRPAVAGTNYGLGLSWKDTTCGVRVYGNDGDALSYQTWSYSTPDLRRQITLSLTPTFEGNPDQAVDALINRVICGRP